MHNSDDTDFGVVGIISDFLSLIDDDQDCDWVIEDFCIQPSGEKVGCINFAYV
jgi:hypothetical protein